MQKKFGTFGGVFTPSILTILGVIMYLRLGWVVGNAGLIGALLVIAIAHIISVTTGLSISSIATDKKVGAGGVYYVLSRSLGLPIGGAIGLTLFVGTALSIALYLVGFSESFLSYFNLSTDINTVRICGSIALLLLTVVALISTGAAIKTQYFIMAAIGASLLSIFLGDSPFKPEHIPFFGDDSSAPLEKVFAIFFPAVTGFTAGIAMSGDLKDPKKSIPVGTMAAIIVGFLVYVILTFFLAYNVPAEILKTDYNILLKIAWFAPAVVAGIWGATLSSALGGILGGPRILQAMSYDGITPKLFARGVGKENEPRNALIFTVIIAEAGILIGELDMIARVVSMFYLAAYGFINLSFFLEKWASSDFNPSFKISKWIGIIGFIATFGVMFKLDMLAMIAAFIVIVLIYLYLAKKQITLGSGDVWQSVWASLVKSGLKRMEAKETHKRNWKPNILLFSVGTEAREHLIEFSKIVVGSGFVTNFDLEEDPTAPVLFPFSPKKIKDALLQKHGIFGKKVVTKNIYEGIETLASTFGFSGVEPNSILLNWQKSSDHPKRFAQLTQHLIELNFNVLYLDYDFRFGFRKRESIDLWWRGISNNSELMLLLARFIANSPEWGNARIRILLVNDLNIDNRIIRNKIQSVLDDYRIEAEIKIINNHLDPKPFYEHMKINSLNTDLVMVGIPAIEKGDEANFVEKTNKLVSVIGTTLLVKASSHFDETDLGLKEHLEVKELILKTSEEQITPLETSVSESVNLQAKQLDGLIQEKLKNTFLNDIDLIAAIYQELFNEIDKNIKNQLESKKLASTKDMLFFVENIQKFANETLKDDIHSVHQVMEEHIIDYFSFFSHQIAQQPHTLIRRFSVADITISESDPKEIVKYKKRLKFLASFLGIKSISIKWKQLAESMFYKYCCHDLKNHFSEFGSITGKIYNQIEQIIQTNTDLFYKQLKEENADKEEVFKTVTLKLNQELQELRKNVENYFASFEIKLLNLHRAYLNEMLLSANKVEINHLLKKQLNISPKEKKIITDQLKNYPHTWKTNQFILLDLFCYSLAQIRLIILINQIYLENIAKVRQLGIKGMLLSLKNLKNRLVTEDNLQNAIKNHHLETDIEVNTDEIYQNFREKIMDTISALPSEAKVPDFDWINHFNETQFETPLLNTLDLQKFSDYILETKYFEPVKHLLNTFFKDVYNAYIKVVQLVNLTTTNMSASENPPTEEMQTLKNNLIEQIDQAIETIRFSFEIFINRLTDISQEAIFSIDLYTVIENSDNIQQYVKSSERKKGLFKITSGIHKYIHRYTEEISNTVNQYITQLQLAENPHTEDTLAAWAAEINRYNTLTEHPDLPFYYYQLFTGKHLFENETYKSFEAIENQIENYIYIKNKKPRKDALWITGDALSGKSYWADNIAMRFSTNGKIIRINYHTNYAFEELLKNHTKQPSVNVENIQMFVPQGTVFILNDIEKWANTAEDLETIIDFVKTHGDKYLIILTSSTIANDYLVKNHELKSICGMQIFVPCIIEKELSKLLYNRHKIGAIELYNEKGKPVEKPSDINTIARKIYLLSQGNVGLSMIYWLASIRKQDEHYYLLPPEKFVFPSGSSLGKINALLYQINLFRQINKDLLIEYFFEAKNITPALEELQAKAIITEPYKNMLETHPLVRIYMQNLLL